MSQNKTLRSLQALGNHPTRCACWTFRKLDMRVVPVGRGRRENAAAIGSRDDDNNSVEDEATTPVGVTIAYRRLEDPHHSHHEAYLTKTKNSSHPKPFAPRHKKQLKPVPSFRVFLEGTALYLACLIVPSLFGYLYQVYWSSLERTKQVTDLPNSIVTSDTLLGYYYEQAASYVCPEPSTVTPDSYTAYLCPYNVPTQQQAPPQLYADAAWGDMGLIIAISLVLAGIRIILTQALVPLMNTSTLEAMVRCKSIHLLSSDYSQTPTRSSSISPKMIHVTADTPVLPDLGGTRTKMMESSSSPDNSQLGMRLDESERDWMMESLPLPPLPTVTDSMDDVLDADESSSNLYTAPRLATAVFRLVYSLMASVLAYYWFHSAHFWPWYVGGDASAASTKNCWDLSGGLTVAMDGDFDQRNQVLKRYFLWQVSYHWHSGAFHVLSMCLLVWHPKHASHRFLSVQTTTFAYVRSLFQHILAIALIAFAYMFSSLRRLTAIGMFAFDVSSIFLHLLQICLNAPETSRIRDKRVIATLYYGGVLPSFVLARIGVWGALWYSATFESKKWLRQLENTLFPRAGTMLLVLFQVWMVLLMSLTGIYLRRLYSHTHLQRILHEEK